MFSGAAGAFLPSKAAEVAAALLTDAPGTDEVAAQGIQAAVNAGVVATAELLNATIRQHGESPAAALNRMQVNIKIQQESQEEK